MHLLAGDIGGTKTSLAIFSREKGVYDPLVQARFASGDYDSLLSIVDAFLNQNSTPVDAACFGVAGPISGRTAKVTNLPWEVNADHLQQHFGFAEVELINDLQAIAQSIPSLRETDFHTVSPGQAQPGGTIAVIAPGTGLGEAFLTWNNTRYQAYPSEGGHADFAPSNQLETALRSFLEAQYDHVSTERVCSGKAIPNLYAFLKQNGYNEPAWLAEQLAVAPDPVPIIINAALEDASQCRICSAALDLFVAILGAEAGNLALTLFATGGVYLGGGIPPRILPALQGDLFRTAFQNKGRLSSVLSRIPVKIILNKEAALLGAACYGFRI